MTVILVDPRRPSLVPVEAIELLSGDVQYTEEMPVKVPWSLPSARSLFTADEDQLRCCCPRIGSIPRCVARLAAGERADRRAEPQAGERLVDAVAIMDKLRTAGPWESEQTHDSLRRYLLEETYELFDAVRGGNADELRDELGDVLLQVLVSCPHRRGRAHSTRSRSTMSPTRWCASSAIGCRRCWPANRSPRRAAGPVGGAQGLRDSSGRVSCVDDVPTGQPALALAQKVIARVATRGPAGDS